MLAVVTSQKVGGMLRSNDGARPTTARGHRWSVWHRRKLGFGTYRSQYRGPRPTIRVRPRGDTLTMNEPDWLTRARELQAIAQIGLAYTKDKFDAERYERIRAIAAAIMASGSGSEVEQVLHLFRQDVGYATPKVDVRGAVFHGGHILLVREVSDGKWTLPGGWADVNQSAAECVERETKEESGFQVRAVKFAAVWDRRRHGHVTRHPHSIYKNVLSLRNHRWRAPRWRRDQRGRILCGRWSSRPFAWSRNRTTDPSHVRALAPTGASNGFRLIVASCKRERPIGASEWGEGCARDPQLGSKRAPRSLAEDARGVGDGPYCGQPARHRPRAVAQMPYRAVAGGGARGRGLAVRASAGIMAAYPR
jgi:ADP-ribose pyrophosphatase YjhB (NUDIX family)